MFDFREFLRSEFAKSRRLFELTAKIGSPCSARRKASFSISWGRLGSGDKHGNAIIRGCRGDAVALINLPPRLLLERWCQIGNCGTARYG